jgi:hypothetical protein
MNDFLHSLPWTIALALAQAGEESPAPRLDAPEQSLSSLSLFEGDAAAPSPLPLNGDEERDAT